MLACTERATFRIDPFRMPCQKQEQWKSTAKGKGQMPTTIMAFLKSYVSALLELICVTFTVATIDIQQGHAGNDQAKQGLCLACNNQVPDKIHVEIGWKVTAKQSVKAQRDAEGPQSGSVSGLAPGFFTLYCQILASASLCSTWVRDYLVGGFS